MTWRYASLRTMLLSERISQGWWATELRNRKTERFEILNKDTELMKTFDYIVHEFFSQSGKVSVCKAH